MIDIHCYLTPDIEHGAKNEAINIEFAVVAEVRFDSEILGLLATKQLLLRCLSK